MSALQIARRIAWLSAGALFCTWISEILVDYTISPFSSGIWVFTTLAAMMVTWLGSRYFWPSDEFLLKLFKHFSPDEAAVRVFLVRAITWLLIFAAMVFALFTDILRTLPR